MFSRVLALGYLVRSSCYVSVPALGNLLVHVHSGARFGLPRAGGTISASELCAVLALGTVGACFGLSRAGYN